MKYLIKILAQTIIWAENYKAYGEDGDYDVLDILDSMIEIEKLTDKRIILIRNLLDFYCDAIKHGFKNIDTNYTIKQANKDIKDILKILRADENAKLPFELYKRLQKLNE